MPTVTLAGQDYEVTGLTEEDQASYRAYCLLLARRADRPILRFLREQCEGMTREERQDALILLPHFPEYLNPPEELVLQWARHPKAVAALARRVLRPKKSGAEWEALLGDDAQGRLAGIPVDTKDRAEVAWQQAARALYDSLVSVLRTISHPSDDQIRAANQALRAAVSQSRTNAGDPEYRAPRPEGDKHQSETQHQGADACAPAADQP